jgi:thiol-disulfide isomerase/thioredoxin
MMKTMKKKFAFLIFSMICLNVMAQFSRVEGEGIRFVDNGKPDSALLLLRNNPKIQKTLNYYYIKGRAEYELNLLDSAIVNLKKVTLFKPRSINNKIIWTLALAHLGRAYVKQEQMDSARFYLRKSVDIETNEWAMGFACQTLKELGDNYGYTKINKMHSIGEKAFNFNLTDLQGKRYNLEMFKKAPLVLHLGTTWCGSCQMDAVGYNAFAESYKKKEIRFAHVFIGETPNSAGDFLKHYRTNMLALMDYNGSNSQKYKSDYLTATFLIDTNQVIQFNNHDVFYNEKKDELKSMLDTMQLGTNNENTHAVCTDESCTVPSSKEDTCMYELSPKAVSDKTNTIWVAFHSNKEGNNNIYLRAYKDGKMVKEYPITRSASDNYSPDITITPDQTIWLCWVSNKNGKYDIYACSYKKGVFSEQTQVTRSYDDAFHPRIVSDNGNNVHLTYYKWDTIRNYSRDRDVFYRSYNGKQWSDEVRVSPSQPSFDDATDPSIICDNNKNVYVAYSYDYHPGNYKKEENVTQATIFLQHVRDTFDPNEQLLIGTKELVYKSVVDITPELAVDSKNTIWCAWDARAKGTRYIFAKRTTDSTETVISEKSAISTNPNILLCDAGKPCIVWNQTEGENWGIFGSKLENGLWTSPIRLVESLNDCKEPVLVSTKNKKHLVYVEYQNKGSRIQLIDLNSY